MVSIESFDVSWMVGGEGFRFVSGRGALALPGGDELVLPSAAWLSLREVLALLPREPGSAGEPLPLPRFARGPANRGRAWTAEVSNGEVELFVVC